MALDVEGIVKNWLNARVDIVGQGKPIARGAHLKRIRTEGSYAFLIAVGTPEDFTAEHPIARARIACTLYGRTKEVATRAAVAYMTALESISGMPEKMGDYKCLIVDNISGPLPLDDHLTTREEFRYQVDADFWITV